MFKGLSNFAKSKSAVWVLVAIIVLFVIWALMSYSKSKGKVSDSMTSGPGYVSGPAPVDAASSVSIVNSTAPVVKKENSSAMSAVNPGDLLPKDSNANFGQSMGPDSVPNPVIVDLLKAGTHIGLDTIGQTLRNANYQLRSDPIIPKSYVCPWNQSTIEPDLGRVPLELGCN